MVTGPALPTKSRQNFFSFLLFTGRAEQPPPLSCIHIKYVLPFLSATSSNCLISAFIAVFWHFWPTVNLWFFLKSRSFSGAPLSSSSSVIHALELSLLMIYLFDTNLVLLISDCFPCSQIQIWILYSKGPRMTSSFMSLDKLLRVLFSQSSKSWIKLLNCTWYWPDLSPSLLPNSLPNMTITNPLWEHSCLRCAFTLGSFH